MNVDFREPEMVKEYERYVACIDDVRHRLKSLDAASRLLLLISLPLGVSVLVFLLILFIFAIKYDSG